MPTNSSSEIQDIAISKDRFAVIRTPQYAEHFIKAYEGQISALLPSNVGFDVFVAQLRKAIVSNPGILQCTQASLLNAVLEATELGLNISGTEGEGWIIPFKNSYNIDGRWTKVEEATFIPGYRGIVKLVYMTNLVENIDAHVVYADDHFIMELGMDRRLEFRPNLNPPDKREVLGVYVLIRDKEGGVHFDWVSKNDLDKIRQSSKAPDSPAWKNWYKEMIKGKALKRVLKTYPKFTSTYADAAANNALRAIELSNRDTRSLNDTVVYEDVESKNDLNALLREAAGQQDSKGEATPPPPAKKADSYPAPKRKVSKPAEHLADSVEVIDEETGEITTGEVEQVAQAKEVEAPVEKTTELESSFWENVKDFFGENIELILELVERIFGSKPTSLDELNKSHMRKINTMVKRFRHHYKDEGQAVSFMHFLLEGDFIFKKAQHIDQLKKQFDDMLESTGSAKKEPVKPAMPKPAAPKSKPSTDDIPF